MKYSIDKALSEFNSVVYIPASRRQVAISLCRELRAQADNISNIVKDSTIKDYAERVGAITAE